MCHSKTNRDPFQSAPPNDVLEFVLFDIILGIEQNRSFRRSRFVTEDASVLSSRLISAFFVRIELNALF